MKKIIILKDIPKLKIGTKTELETLENQYDDINTHILLGSVYVSQLLPIIGTASLTGDRVDKSTVLKAMAKVLFQVTAILEYCEAEYPTTREVEDFKAGIPTEIQVDGILILFSMIGAFADTSAIINVDIEEPIWGLDELPMDFEENILTILSGMYNLGTKYGFKFEDILDIMDVMD